MINTESSVIREPMAHVYASAKNEARYNLSELQPTKKGNYDESAIQRPEHGQAPTQ